MAQKTGVVKFFRSDKGYGFIAQDDGGEDVFVHHQGVRGSGLVEGDKVTFSLVTDEMKGKLKAEDVYGGSAPEKSTGTVKFYSEEKGFGFITPNDGSEDVFVHRNSISGGMLMEGDQVEFDKKMDEVKQKVRAEGVRGGSGGKGGGGKGMGKGGGGGYAMGGGAPGPYGGGYGAPQQMGGGYGAPQQQMGGGYGAPQQQMGGGYGAPQQQMGGGYGAPQGQYGAPQGYGGGGNYGPMRG